MRSPCDRCYSIIRADGMAHGPAMAVTPAQNALHFFPPHLFMQQHCCTHLQLQPTQLQVVPPAKLAMHSTPPHAGNSDTKTPPAATHLQVVAPAKLHFAPHACSSTIITLPRAFNTHIHAALHTPPANCSLPTCSLCHSPNRTSVPMHTAGLNP
jgi:hypothetical protein